MDIFKSVRLPVAKLQREKSGSVLVEFALLSPVFFGLLLGVFQIGAYAQNYNAVRNLASDGSRFALIQYQRNTALTTTQLQQQIFAIGVGNVYKLNPDHLSVTVVDASSRITGVKEMKLTIGYAAPNWLNLIKVPGMSLSYTRPLFLLKPA